MSTVINGKVYYGGGVTCYYEDDDDDDDDDEFNVYTAMTHHKTTGPLYHHFLSGTLVWVKSVAN